jgi:hypothetical protein
MLLPAVILPMNVILPALLSLLVRLPEMTVIPNTDGTRIITTVLTIPNINRVRRISLMITLDFKRS